MVEQGPSMKKHEEAKKKQRKGEKSVTKFNSWRSVEAICPRGIIIETVNAIFSNEKKRPVNFFMWGLDLFVLIYVLFLFENYNFLSSIL